VLFWKTATLVLYNNSTEVVSHYRYICWRTSRTPT